jgi:hypothetical protein
MLFAGEILFQSVATAHDARRLFERGSLTRALVPSRPSTSHGCSL